MLRVEDGAFADHVRAYVAGEVARSREITADLYRAEATPWRRLVQFGAYLLVAVVDPTVSRGLALR